MQGMLFHSLLQHIGLLDVKVIQTNITVAKKPFQSNIYVWVSQK